MLRPESKRSQVCDVLKEKMFQEEEMVNAKFGMFEGQ